MLEPGQASNHSKEVMKKKPDNTKLEKLEFTLQEIWEAMRGNVWRNKKKYRRKTKHRDSGTWG